MTLPSDAVTPHGRGGPATVVVAVASVQDAPPLARLLEALRGLDVAVVVAVDTRNASADAMASVLGRSVAVPVVPLHAEAHPLRPGQVVVAPGDRSIEAAGGVLSTPAVQRAPGERLDRLIGSIAADGPGGALCVVMSRHGEPCLQGLRDVQAHGGLVIAVSDAATRPALLPDDRIDVRVPPDELPAAVRRHAVIVNAWHRDGLDADFQHAAADALRRRLGRDAHCFAPPVMSRSLRRRVALAGEGGPERYLRRLDADDDEPSALMRDLLLRPAGFFRTREAWLALVQDVVAPAFRDADPVAEWRVWVPSCGTGEEAYTVAITLMDQAEVLGHHGRVTVFATDPDPHAVMVARAGRYGAAVQPYLARHHVERFFRIEGDELVVRRHLRQSMVFAAHDLLDDPPFSRLDLVVCRDFLPLLMPAAQARVLERLRFGVMPGRVLMLGRGESAPGLDDAFQPIGSCFGLYRRAGRPPSDPAGAPRAPQAQRLLEEELQRTRQELTQARETVESTHEELTAVNRLLSDRITDVERANDDLSNLIASTHTPMLFLDPDLRVRRYTPAATQLFRLIPGDVGRLLGDLASRCPMDRLLADAKHVLDDEAPVERELGIDQEHWLQRVLPYRDRDGRLGGVVVTFTDITEATRTRRELRAAQDLSRRIEQAREEERTRIAREIHDELGGTLTGIRMHLEAARAHAEANEIDLPHQLGAVPELVDSASHAVQRIIADLRPSVLDHLGVWTAITWYAERVLPSAGIAWRADIAPEAEAAPLEPERATAIFRIAQEALTNVARHAGAHRVDIRARRDESALVVEVRDDGRGIEPARDAPWRPGGLLGMRERARHHGGQVVVRAQPAGGTEVILRMPLP